jgi:hypothetical protein
MLSCDVDQRRSGFQIDSDDKEERARYTGKAFKS